MRRILVLAAFVVVACLSISHANAMGEVMHAVDDTFRDIGVSFREDTRTAARSIGFCTGARL